MVEHLDTNHNHINEISTVGFACDIDETLSNTAIPAFAQIQKEFGNPENLTPEEMLEKYGLLENVPYWKEKELHDRIEKYFQEEKSYLELEPQPDAVKHLLNIVKTIPIAAYITARKAHLHTASIQWLERLGFPKAPILMNTKGDMITHRSEWKAGLLKHLHPKVTGIIDDDINLPAKLDPDYKGFLILFGHDEAPKTNFEIHVAKNWSEVETIMLKR